MQKFLTRSRSTGYLIIFLILTMASNAVPSQANPRLTKFSEFVFSSRSKILAADGKISKEVAEDLQRQERVSVVILMAEQADVSDAYDIEDQDERGWYVYRKLTDHARATQSSLVNHLESRGVSFKTFWIASMVVAELDSAMAVEVAGRSDVARLDSNRAARWIEEPEVSRVVSADTADQTGAIEWGVSNVKAPEVWALGFNGTGIVVGGLDTGIRWSHNAIKSKYRGWNGTTADHNYNWWDSVHSGGGSCGANTTAPCDDNGHGSHTVGTMVGDDTTGNQIGVAPGAKWIGCRNMNQGDGSPATYSECFQFMIAPTDSAGNNPNPSLRPHILNNSWGCPSVEGCTTRAELEVIVNNTQAAGIFVQSSAGNNGNSCSSVRDPLAIYDASFAAGSITDANAISSFSSFGPSTFYDPVILKPNIVAPGSNVRSISRSNDSTYSFSSGTSMASPHVAGVVALLWSAKPSLVRRIGATKAILQSTANPNVIVSAQTCGGIPSSQIPNNSFGYGRVDALAAVNAVVPTAVITGRVLTPEGNALRNAVVSVVDANNTRQTATTSSFGFFTLPPVLANESYTISIASKRYRFASRSITVTGNLAVPDFVGLQ